jgi:hypothetical protein
VRRVVPTAAVAAASIFLAACGGSGGGGALKPPQGPPSARHPASQIAAMRTGEEMRVHLLVAARLYNNMKFGFTTAQMNAAKALYPSISGAVQAKDFALDREMNAAFPVIATEINQRLPALGVTNRMGLVQGQLLDAAIKDATTKPAFNDAGVTAQVMMQLAEQGAREYANAARVGGFTPQGRRNYQDAFGLLTRASSLSHQISSYLGPQRGAVINGLGDAHQAGFATGVLVPRVLHPVAVTAGVQKARAAVSQRFGFAA